MNPAHRATDVAGEPRTPVQVHLSMANSTGRLDRHLGAITDAVCGAYAAARGATAAWLLDVPTLEVLEGVGLA